MESVADPSSPLNIPSARRVYEALLERNDMWWSTKGAAKLAGVSWQMARVVLFKLEAHRFVEKRAAIGQSGRAPWVWRVVDSSNGDA